MWDQQALVGQVVALLQASPSVAPVVTRRTSRPVADGVDKAVRVRLGPSIGEQILLSGVAPTDWSAVVAVECLARCGATQSPDEAVGPLVSAVYARILTDTTLPVAGFQLDPAFRIEPDQDELDERIGVAVLSFTVRWRSQHNSIEV
jgi:hypothetical protein